MQVREGTSDLARIQTLRYLRKHGLIELRNRDEETRVCSDWRLTELGQRVAQRLAEGGVAYLPGEFEGERALFEESLSETKRDARAPARRDVPKALDVATWNLRSSSDPSSVMAYLENAEWDVACLQEVGVVFSNRLRGRADWDVVNGLEFAWSEVSSWKAPHAAAIVARNGWQLAEGALLPDTPVPGRGVSAVAHKDGEAASLLSWHAPHAVPGDGETKATAIARKMQAYRSLVSFIEGVDGPLILGMDANNWNLRTDLDLPPPAPATDPFYDQDAFFSATPAHRLSDALLAYLRANPTKHAELKALRPDGPLEVTHRRGGHGKADRFDYIMISAEFAVDRMAHHYEQACAAGSDHALITASLRS
jgi:endonuclease/exonuclease/phosphatase family metal-dependent hydrolase